MLPFKMCGWRCAVKLFRCLSFHSVSVPEVPVSDALSPSAGVVFMSVVQTRFCGGRMACVASGEGNDADRQFMFQPGKKPPVFIRGGFCPQYALPSSVNFRLVLFHPEAGPLDQHHLGMVEDAVEDCAGYCRVVVEDKMPFVELAVGCYYHASPLIS